MIQKQTPSTVLIAPYLLLLFILLFSQNINAQQTIDGTLMHDGIQRTYILYVPQAYNASTPAPLVLNFHGYTSNAIEQINYGDFRPLADEDGFLIVVPQGTVDTAGNTHFNVGWGTSTVDDIGFINALLDDLSTQYTINQDRIYSTGMSNGGFMSYKLACELSDRIAAIASVTGSMTLGTTGSCNPLHPTPVLEIHGTSDGTVNYNGSNFATAIPDVLSYWSNYNNTDTTPTVTSIPRYQLNRWLHCRTPYLF
ncbi:prolyl oligopeptidase family serine peptidase [Lacinutrix neustonica]|uniref:Prolyl oligopeptidase family serine peptidase n=1 Tax=Lacinutrix neustonica TaxID=2980107 RepID=A0A9E8SG45_9FLAO|nr:PHB depolymerase family esterase [Lacinutrix neustonica]WAC01355.1 prolyl oligopeptidase family serine peptidase [Lacinutrix neustonica]